MSTRKRGRCAVEMEVSDELPPGWTVKVRVRRRKSGCRQKRDKFYIDPETGHVFGSMKQVLHYIQTGEIIDRRSKKIYLINPKPKRRGTPSVPSEDENESVSEITTRKYVQEHQTDKDRDLKLLSEGEGDGFPDLNANEKMSKGTVKRARTYSEEKHWEKRMKEGEIPGNTSDLLPPQAKFPETSAVVIEKRIINGGQDCLNQKQLMGVEVDELKEKETTNQTDQVSVLKLSEGKEVQLRDVLKTLKGPVLLPAGYIPLPPEHPTAKPFDSPPTRAISTGGNNCYAPSTTTRPNGDLWDDHCLDFAVKILASESEYKREGDPGIRSAFLHGFNSSTFNR